MRVGLRTVAALVLLLAFGGSIAQGQTPDALRVTFLNVGQGDAVLIQAPEGQTALVDAGPVSVLGALRSLGVSQIDLLVVSHPHADHISGAAEVIDAMPVRFYMDNGRPHTTATYLHLMDVLDGHTEIRYLAPEPRRISLGGATIEVLPLPTTGPQDQNNRSVGLVVRYGEFVVFLSGDSERLELDHFLRLGVVPDVTVLKAPHHGSDNGYTPEFLRAARPEVVVIPVGPNSYGHPMESALIAYHGAADAVYRTDYSGHVTIYGRTDGTYEVVLSNPVTETMRPGAPGPTSDSGGSAGPVTVGITVHTGEPGQPLTDEYVVIENRSSGTISLDGWRLCHAADHCFRFPARAEIPPGQALVVSTGSGLDDGITFYMNSTDSVWDRDRGVVTLFDKDGRVVGRQAYE